MLRYMRRKSNYRYLYTLNLQKRVEEVYLKADLNLENSFFFSENNFQQTLCRKFHADSEYRILKPVLFLFFNFSLENHFFFIKMASTHILFPRNFNLTKQNAQIGLRYDLAELFLYLFMLSIGFLNRLFRNGIKNRKGK